MRRGSLIQSSFCTVPLKEQSSSGWWWCWVSIDFCGLVWLSLAPPPPLLWASVEAPSLSKALSLPSSSPLDHVLLAPRSLPAKSVTSVSQYRSEQELHCYVYYVRRRRSPPTPFAPRTISTKVILCAHVHVYCTYSKTAFLLISTLDISRLSLYATTFIHQMHI